MSPPRRLSAVLQLLLLPAALVTPAVASGPMLISASSDEHLWFIVPHADSGPPWVLRHHAAAAGAAFFTGGLTLAEAPQRLAASGDRLWLINAPQQVGGSWRRAVFTVEVRHNPAFDTHYYDPPDRLGIEAMLDGGGTLEGFVGTSAGPVALLCPDPDGADDGGGGAAAALAKARLVRLEASTWVDLALPESFPSGDERAGVECRLVSAGEGGSDLIVLAATGGDAAVAAWWSRPGSTWQRFDLDQRLDSRPWSLIEVVATTRVGAAAALVLRDIAGDGGDAEVAYLRPRRLLPLARVPIGSESWAIMGVRDGFCVLELAEDRTLSIRRLDAVSGQVEPAETMTGQHIATGPIVHLLLVSAMAVGVLLVLFLIRGRPKPGSVEVQAGLEPLPLTLRLFSAAIDTGLGAAGAIAMLGGAPEDLARLPMWTPVLADAVPGLVAAGLTVAHTAALELIIGRSLGKLLVGARVVAAADGGRPRTLAILARNAAKLLLLLVPVLVVVMAMNPNRQGIDDLLGRTIVVRRRARPESSPGPKDR